MHSALSCSCRSFCWLCVEDAIKREERYLERTFGEEYLRYEATRFITA